MKWEKQTINDIKKYENRFQILTVWTKDIPPSVSQHVQHF